MTFWYLRHRRTCCEVTWPAHVFLSKEIFTRFSKYLIKPLQSMEWSEKWRNWKILHIFLFLSCSTWPPGTKIRSTDRPRPSWSLLDRQAQGLQVLPAHSGDCLTSMISGWSPVPGEDLQRHPGQVSDDAEERSEGGLSRGKGGHRGTVDGTVLSKGANLTW